MQPELAPLSAIPPAQLYVKLNHILWLNRLPAAKIVLVEDSFIPLCRAITVHDGDLFAKPIILINLNYKHWSKTLVHEMIHVAEPRLPHGRLFDRLIEFNWRIAKSKIKGLSNQ